MQKILSINYREEVEEFLNRFIEVCDKCDNSTQEMKRTAEMLLRELEQYSQKH